MPEGTTRIVLVNGATTEPSCAPTYPGASLCTTEAKFTTGMAFIVSASHTIR